MLLPLYVLSNSSKFGGINFVDLLQILTEVKESVGCFNGDPEYKCCYNKIFSSEIDILGILTIFKEFQDPFPLRSKPKQAA